MNEGWLGTAGVIAVTATDPHAPPPPLTPAPATERFVVTQGLLVDRVRPSGAGLQAVLTSAATDRRHVVWTLPGEGMLTANWRTLRQWGRTNALLTLVESPGGATLVDERSLLDRAFRPRRGWRTSRHSKVGRRTTIEG